jgi:hypothetical protein
MSGSVGDAASKRAGCLRDTDDSVHTLVFTVGFHLLWGLGQNVEGLRFVLAEVSAGGFVPVSASLACGMHDAKALLLGVLLLTLIVGWPSDITALATLLKPIGAGLVLGQLCRQAIREQQGAPS